MKVLRALSILVALGAAWVAGYGYGRWYGPKAQAAVAAPAHASKGYVCPMHPQYHSDKPGDCPICGMKLVPAGGEAMTPTPEGAMHVSPEKQQMIGVKFGTVEPASAARTFRANGRVQADETRISKVQSRIEGWIDKVAVDFNGKLVAKGEPLLTLYSPEMLASQQEYLLALKSSHILPDGGKSLIAASRRRLELLEASAEQIATLERTGEPIKNITIYSPISGYVMERKAFPKQRITPDTELYTVADLSRVWIMADVFESDASSVREGMPVRITLAYGSARTLAGRVNYIQPAVDPATRTLKVRIEAENPNLALKPEMFVDVDFAIGQSARLSVPADAVIDTGLQQRVFVDRGNGYLEPRTVTIGARIGDRIEILRGLGAGERIVVSGAFLIDSESQLRGPAAEHSHD